MKLCLKTINELTESQNTFVKNVQKIYGSEIAEKINNEIKSILENINFTNKESVNNINSLTFHWTGPIYNKLAVVRAIRQSSCNEIYNNPSQMVCFSYKLTLKDALDIANSWCFALASTNKLDKTLPIYMSGSIDVVIESLKNEPNLRIEINEQ
jgi:hypothetical protein